MVDREYARRAEEVVWRRNKLGWRMRDANITALDDWMIARRHELCPKVDGAVKRC